MNDFTSLRRHMRGLETAPRRTTTKRNTMTTTTTSGTVVFFDNLRAFGFVTPDGVDPNDKTNHLFLSAHALRRAGIASLDRGDRIALRIEEPRKPGRRREAQGIELLERAA
jgi:cold shock CspA family protein